MQQKIIAFGSVNFALRGKEIAERTGVSCKIVRLERTQTQKGCSYGLSVPSPLVEAIRKKLIAEEVPFSEIVG